MHLCRVVLGAGLLIGCVGDEPPPDPTRDTTSPLVAPRHAHRGKQLFEQPLPGSNGRSCATCHVLDDSTTLSVENVAARWAADPSDALFHPLDADDPAASPLTFAHLARGLVRVTLPLPPNMDVIDEDGNVITRPDRTIEVWRGVPSIENTAGLAPFQYDGREPDLPGQAQAAIIAHSQGPLLAANQLDQIAAFERTQFSSPRAQLVGALLELGFPIDWIPNPEHTMPLSPAERRGRDVFELACAGCHGGATTNRITNRVVHDALFFELDEHGYILHDVAPGQPPTPRLRPQPDNEFLNIGIGLLSGYGQLGFLPMFNDSVELPRYRFRFYTDDTRTQKVTDLPPIPRPPGGGYDLTIGVDQRGAPIVGPSLGNQWFSTDPGRAIVTGDPADFEAFDVPQLRGIAKTSPYFHDNNAGTLEEVVDLYSRFILPFPTLGLPPVHEGEIPGIPESLTIQQKRDLVTFLRRL